MRTFGTFSTKNAIKDIGKVLDNSNIEGYSGEINAKFRQSVADMFPTISTFNDLKKDEETKQEVFDNFINQNSSIKQLVERFPLWFELVLKLEGLIKISGVHASGVLISPKPLKFYAPLFKNKDSEDYVFSLDMYNAMDDLKLVKMDFLGLRNLDIIDETLRYQGTCWEDFDLDALDFDDKGVLKEIYEKANTNGVFQCESLEAKKMLRELHVNTIEDAIALIAFNRPGTKGNFPIYLRNQVLPLREKEILHPDLIETFSKTEGVLLYQEQALKIFEFAGFPEDERDNARRCVDEDTLILMADGFLKKIKHVNVGEYVVSYKDNTSCLRKVINKFDNGLSMVNLIITEEDTTLKCTDTHKILTDRGWITSKELKVGDIVYQPRLNSSLFADAGVFEQVKVKEIQRNIQLSHVYDLEIEDTHNYLANTIVVHNCIGHKDAVKMKELKVKFVDLMHQKPNWTDDKIEEVWKLMELQASYSLYDTFYNEKL